MITKHPYPILCPSHIRSLLHGSVAVDRSCCGLLCEPYRQGRQGRLPLSAIIPSRIFRRRHEWRRRPPSAASSGHASWPRSKRRRGKRRSLPVSRISNRPSSADYGASLVRVPRGRHYIANQNALLGSPHTLPTTNSKQDARFVGGTLVRWRVAEEREGGAPSGTRGEPNSAHPARRNPVFRSLSRSAAGVCAR